MRSVACLLRGAVSSLWHPVCGILHQARSILCQSAPPCVACMCCLVSCVWRLAAMHHCGFTETEQQYAHRVCKQQQQTVHQLPMCCWPTGRTTAVRHQQQRLSVTFCHCVLTGTAAVSVRQQQQRLCQLHVCHCVLSGTTSVSVRHQQQRLCQLHVCHCVYGNNCCQCQTSATETVSVTCFSLLFLTGIATVSVRHEQQRLSVTCLSLC